MWFWIFILIVPFIILLIFEEMIEFFVNRYAQGPAAWEGKWKEFVKNKVNQLKERLGRAPVSSKDKS